MRMILDLPPHMRVTLIHNPEAGCGGATRDEIIAALHGAGHDVVYRSTLDEGLEQAVQEADDAILVAGGDGTLRRVALAAAPHVPVSVLGLGTANNMATTLGIDGDLDASVRRLRHGRRQRLDLGSCDGAWGRRTFLEGVGFGLVPELIRVIEKFAADMHPADVVAELGHARSVLARLVALLPAFDCALTINGETRTRRLIMLEVLNAQRVGPSLPLASTADPTDGRLDIVWVEESQRDRLGRAATAWAAGQEADFSCGMATAAHVSMCCDASIAHVDDLLWRPHRRRPAGCYDVSVTCRPGALTLLL
jgi:diacylglycerol kinase (ATP)